MDYKKTFGEGDAAIELTIFEQELEHGLIGMMTSERFEHKLVGLAQEKDESADSGYDNACLKVFAETHGFVYMSKATIALLRRGDGVAEMVLLHELGHYVHKDFLRTRIYSEADRRAVVERGEVLQKELDADAFAAEYMGKEAAAAALVDLKAFMQQKYANPEEWDASTVKLAIDEATLREQHIRG